MFEKTIVRVMKWHSFPWVSLVIMAAFAGIVADRQSARADAVAVWGRNAYGQVGDGTTGTWRPTPVVISSLGYDLASISAGGEHTLALKSNGSLWAWGLGGDGQLGDGTGSNKNTPVAVSGLTSGVVAVAAGKDHSIALKSDGSVWAWGDNFNGQIGDGTSAYRGTPVAVNILTSGVTAIAAGDSHNLALKSDGSLWAWGADAECQLGNGGTHDCYTPVAVKNLTSGVIAIAAGWSHSLAVKSDGSVWAWGWSSDGQIGDGSTATRPTPVAVSGLTSGVTAVAAAFRHSLALRNGTVWAWGYNRYGQLGDGTTVSCLVPEEIDPADLTDITAIAADWGSSYALSRDGSLWVWGDNSYGELGLGNATSHLTPTHLLPPVGYRFTSIDAGSGKHAVATLAAVPEPGSLALLSAAVAALAAWAWQRNRGDSNHGPGPLANSTPS